MEKRSSPHHVPVLRTYIDSRVFANHNLTIVAIALRPSGPAQTI